MVCKSLRQNVFNTILFLVSSLCVQAVYKCLLDRVPEEQKDTNVQ